MTIRQVHTCTGPNTYARRVLGPYYRMETEHGVNANEVTGAVLADVLTDLIDSSHQYAADLAIAAAELVETGDLPLDGDDPEQRIGDLIRQHVVGARLAALPMGNPGIQLQDGLWQTLMPMVDWALVGQHYQQRDRADMPSVAAQETLRHRIECAGRNQR